MSVFSRKRAAPTRAEYERSFAAFGRWCSDSDELALPASREAILGYARFLRGSVSPASIRTRLAAINAAHCDQKKTAPIDRRLWGDLAHALKGQPEGERKKFGLVDMDLSRLLSSCGDQKPNDIRDRAIMLCSRHAALTISQVIELSMADLEWTDRGCRLRIDPPRELVRIQDRWSVCPVRTLKRWLAVDGRVAGPVFSITRMGVQRMMERRMSAVGLDRVKYSHISLRFGMWVDLAHAGKDTREIARTYGVSVDQLAKILERHGSRSG